MVPDRCASEVNVEVSVGVLHTHDAIFLNLRLRLRERRRAGPNIIHPTQFSCHKRGQKNLKNKILPGANLAFTDSPPKVVALIFPGLNN